MKKFTGKGVYGAVAIGRISVFRKPDAQVKRIRVEDTAAEKARECGVPEVYAFTDKKALADKLFETLKQGDAVLFKASRGMALEDVINDLYGRMDK